MIYKIFDTILFITLLASWYMFFKNETITRKVKLFTMKIALIFSVIVNIIVVPLLPSNWCLDQLIMCILIYTLGMSVCGFVSCHCV